jgi:hypothetical protein
MSGVATAPAPPATVARTPEGAVTGGRPAPPPGPVLMGDIQAGLGGTPLLLLLWRRWADAD